MKTALKFKKEDKVVVLTGAGISAESGLKTFRDNDGLWENHRVEEVATPQAFQSDPRLVWKFYKLRYFQLSEVKPNPGHFALKKLEDFLGKNFFIITQNVDGLHQQAGNERVLEMHGSLRNCFCIKCKTKYKMKDIDLTPDIPSCDKCGGAVRPDVVWFGEIPYFLNEIDEIIKKADYFLVVGTSGVVYPAAQFLYIAKMRGAKTIGANLEAPENMHFIDEFHQGKSGEILPELVDLWIL
ncbi:MAG: NAD-dependent deacylase [Candidatus Cloacimonetes bacterium]|nr:NAD-dependent deacylase [Candidatus Cloacimonadota bacterium]